MILPVNIYQRTIYSYFGNTFWSLYPFPTNQLKASRDEESHSY